MNKLKPGAVAPKSGQYEIISRVGKPTGVERTSTKGSPLPPTPERGQTYKLTDATRHGKTH